MLKRKKVQLLSRIVTLLLLIVLWLTFLSSVARAENDVNIYVFDPIRTATLIAKLCEARWPNRSDLQNHCREEQRLALSELYQAAPTLGSSAFDIGGDHFEAIRNRCGAKWKPDFKLWAFCESQQKEALVKLKNRDEGDFPAVRTLCVHKWPVDFVMQNACEMETIQRLKTGR